MGKMNLPCFDGRTENYDKWVTEWAAFAEEVHWAIALILTCLTLASLL